MTPAAAAKLIDEAQGLLSHERALLMEGRYDDLMKAAERREALLAALTGAGDGALAPQRGRLSALRAAAERNLRLLEAALDGVAAARRRLTAAKQARAGLSGYDAKGAPVETRFGKPDGRRA
jgi:hypothetical protein